MDFLTRSADFTPTRAAALRRLAAFLPHAGARYRDTRNFDFGPDDRSNVSALSAHVRHGLIKEDEIIRAVLERFAPSTAEKFIQEVFWRTYWKGWLEMRPGVWQRYRADVDRLHAAAARNAGLRTGLAEAVEGRTGIDGFDDWARELVETGWLHNHARMWFASIWIFTLKLPWQLGADFFLRHLIDGDPASNTLSWRWVAGLHTRDKTYLARASNIAEFTRGRFRPENLAPFAAPLPWDEPPSPQPVVFGPPPSGAPSLLLVTEEDCAPAVPAGVAGFLTWQLTQARSPLGSGDRADAFAAGALADARARLKAAGLGDTGVIPADAALAGPAMADAARRAGVREIITPHAPVGPVADALRVLAPALSGEGMTLRFTVRALDRLAWPKARAGFFGFKEHIPAFLAALETPKAPAAPSSLQL
ncbi:MAG: deoxyribodipyrimidine photolyase [Rhizobiaceae bacterium]|nr:deoxyribodipyrimidine photolyase [Rhizobiaceae bacterium]